MSNKNFGLNLQGALVGFFVLLLVMLATLLVSGTTFGFVQRQAVAAAQASRPAELSLTLIQDSNCQDCSDLTPLIAAIQQQNPKIISQKNLAAGDPEAQQLISQYQIQQLPTLLVSGELDKNPELAKLWPSLGEIVAGVFVLKPSWPPYFDLASGQIRGQMEITLLMDRNCPGCYDVTKHLAILASFGLPTKQQKILDLALPEAQQLIKDYKIELVPTLILTGDLAVYQAFQKVWSQVGTTESDGHYIFRQGVSQMGTYRNLKTGQIITPAPAPTSTPAVQ